MESPWQECACSALFPSLSALNDHLDEYKSLKTNLEKTIASASLALESCRAHSAAFEDGHEQSTKVRNCPYNGCKRVQAFSKLKEVRIHYRGHVECNEVCLCCGGRFKLASAFLRHIPDASQMDRMMAHYMSTRRENLVRRVDKELFEAEGRKNKTQEEDEDRRPPKRVKLTEIDPTASNGM
ncbi:hypothetical protein B0T24DRAFT_629773 [Lasiosphaeria ovina]|uniref:Uncharacterized protein n=1 Tax=Lasiosphaeria ovina TaxID=92902 RepID=A0AAE0N5K2_9PEZI|nr:hypothetical protein B0T24DRAFT_629773 [Lasiosphaeria ovina]